MFLFCLVFAMFCARLFICALWSPAGKGLTSWLSFVVSSVSLSLSHWYPGSGVVLDCIDSWSLHHYLLFFQGFRCGGSTFAFKSWVPVDFIQLHGDCPLMPTKSIFNLIWKTKWVLLKEWKGNFWGIKYYMVYTSASTPFIYVNKQFYCT